MTENLKPCPFCGGEACVEKVTEDYPNYVVRCRGCRVNTAWYEDKNQVIQVWNTRAADAEVK